eukprot:GFUD01003821.1.p1 GENE.GFUD01003821.1~~GFUD01003821.1.p1  ORF type:complete len:399 (+),score=92.24 GFUD01003821.1:99-1295(+)
MSRQFLLNRLLGMDQEEVALHHGEEYFEQVPQWTVEDVVKWLKKVGFGEYVSVFEQCGVDGDILLLLKDKDIKEDLQMQNGILRKRFLRELKNLRKTSDYSSCDGADIADFLSTIGADFREYSYNLVSKDMSVDYMKKLGAADLQDMLKEVGVDNIVHQHKIVDAVISLDEEFQSNDSSESSETSYDVYLTYPKSKGAELASLIKMQLELRGISVFADSHESAHVSKTNLKLIQETKHFVLILPPSGLDSCLVQNRGSEKLRAELVAALAVEANIVPVVDNFQWPDQEELHEDVRAVSYFNCVRWVHDYQDACISKLERFLRGDNYLKVDSPFSTMGRISMARSRRSSGISTPVGRSRRSSGMSPLSQSMMTNLLMVPRSLRASKLSLVSNDSGLEAH